MRLGPQRAFGLYRLRGWGASLLTLALFVALACTPEASDLNSSESVQPRLDPVPAIEFDLALIGGGRARLEDYRGRMVLLDFWATWCPPCVTEIPELNAFYASQRKRGVELLAISVDDLDTVKIEEWVEEQGVRYPVALGNEELARRYGAHAYPFHVLIAADGALLELLEPGFHNERELIATLDQYRAD